MGLQLLWMVYPLLLVPVSKIIRFLGSRKKNAQKVPQLSGKQRHVKAGEKKKESHNSHLNPSRFANRTQVPNTRLNSKKSRPGPLSRVGVENMSFKGKVLSSRFCRKFIPISRL